MNRLVNDFSAEKYSVLVVGDSIIHTNFSTDKSHDSMAVFLEKALDKPVFDASLSGFKTFAYAPLLTVVKISDPKIKYLLIELNPVLFAAPRNEKAYADWLKKLTITKKEVSGLEAFLYRVFAEDVTVQSRQKNEC